MLLAPIYWLSHAIRFTKCFTFDPHGSPLKTHFPVVRMKKWRCAPLISGERKSCPDLSNPQLVFPLRHAGSHRHDFCFLKSQYNSIASSWVVHQTLLVSLGTQLDSSVAVRPGHVIGFYLWNMNRRHTPYWPGPVELPICYSRFSLCCPYLVYTARGDLGNDTAKMAKTAQVPSDGVQEPPAANLKLFTWAVDDLYCIEAVMYLGAHLLQQWACLNFLVPLQLSFAG